MKIRFLTLLTAVLCISALAAQTKASIIDELNTPRKGQGTVKVYVEDDIKALIDGALAAPKTTDDTLPVPVRTGSTVIKRPGYKIQVFSGNNQRKSKDEAYYKQSLIHNEFPDIETTVSFHSPFWRLRAGNYQTYAEATQAMVELKKAFPTFGKEMYVVKDQISVTAN